MKTQPSSKHYPPKEIPHSHRVSHDAIESPREQRKLNLRDFMFGFLVGLVIFGIAAVIICNALIGMVS